MREHYFRLRAKRLKRGLLMSSPKEFSEWARSLAAEGALVDPIEIRVQDGRQLLHLVNLHLIPEYRPADDAAEANAGDDWGGSIVAYSRPEFEHCVSADMSAALPKEVFDQLWDVAAEGGELWLMVAMSVQDNERLQLALSTDQDYKGTGLTVARIEAHAADETTCEWFENRRAMQLMETLRQLHFQDTWHNQVELVCKELASDLARLEDSEVRMEKLPQVFELIRAAKSAFREPLTGTGGNIRDNAYELDKTGFDAYIASYDDKKQGELRAQYNTLWHHFKLSHSVVHGQDAAGPVKSGMRCAQEDLDYVASKYSALGARAPALEWLLLDALVFGECLGFAQYINSEEQIAGIVLPQPLKPKTGWKTFGQELSKSAGQALLEGLKLVVTFAVAWGVTQGNEVATWIVVTGYTLWRWLRKLRMWRELNPKVRLTELLSKMEWVSEALKRPEFNARGVRHQIHALTLEGVTFSPWVLNLLDRRVERSDSDGQVLCS